MKRRVLLPMTLHHSWDCVYYHPWRYITHEAACTITHDVTSLMGRRVLSPLTLHHSWGGVHYHSWRYITLEGACTMTHDLTSLKRRRVLSPMTLHHSWGGMYYHPWRYITHEAACTITHDVTSLMRRHVLSPMTLHHSWGGVYYHPWRYITHEAACTITHDVTSFMGRRVLSPMTLHHSWGGVYYHPWRYVTHEAACTLTQAVLVAHCITAMHPFMVCQTTPIPLQSVQLSTARTVLPRRKFKKITPILGQLCWLPLKFRIEFKILSIVIRTASWRIPTYLSSHGTDICLDQVNHRHLKCLATPTIHFDRGSCVVHGPASWNHLLPALPWRDDYQSVKRKTKKFIFYQHSYVGVIVLLSCYKHRVLFYS